MDDRLVQLTSCPSCGVDLTPEQSRDRLTLNDVSGQVQDLNDRYIRYVDRWTDHLLAWRCRACSVVVPAYDITSRTRHLARRLFFEPILDPSNDDHKQGPFTDRANYNLDSEQRLLSLTTEELREHCRYWDWLWWTQTNAYNSWWCSKALSRAEAELDRRGLHRDSW